MAAAGSHVSAGLTDTGPGQCGIITLPEFTDPRGNLSFMEGGRHIPFDIKRVFYLYGVPSGEHRAAHALIRCQQCLVAVAGSLDVTVDDGHTTKTYHLDRRNAGLYIPARVWRELLNFSGDCVCVVLASEFYDPDDYYNDYSEFKKAVEGAQE